MRKLPPPIPTQYRQPRFDDDSRIILEDNLETVQYIPDTHLRFWYNNQFVGYASHHHDDLEFIICLDQGYDIDAGGNSYHLTPGDILFIPPHMVHEIKPCMSGSRFICLINVDVLNFFSASTSFRPVLMEPFLCTPVTKPNIYQSVYDSLMRCINIYFADNVMAEMEIYAHFIQVFATITKDFYKPEDEELSSESSSTSKEHYQKILALLNYIEDNFEEDISLEKAASLTGFSKYHFSRLFKEQTNSTYYDYLVKRRIHEAQILLYTDTSITDIAFQTGFNNLTTFCRSFKKISGMSPSEYRSQFRNGPADVKLGNVIPGIQEETAS